MRITVASFKGGVGKSTTAVHLAAYLQSKGKTIVIDGDPNRSVLAWAERGRGFPFQVVDINDATNEAVDQYKHVIVDTPARPDESDLRALAQACDLLVIPTTPEIMSLHALMLTVEMLQRIDHAKYRVLLSIVPPKPSRDAEEARAYLKEHGFPVFKAGIRRFAAFQKAALAGVLIQDVSDPRSYFGWDDYTAVGRELMR